eukprot:4975304-Pleurochrysis_carterae.AAC.1
MASTYLMHSFQIIKTACSSLQDAFWTLTHRMVLATQSASRPRASAHSQFNWHTHAYAWDGYACRMDIQHIPCDNIPLPGSVI